MIAAHRQHRGWNGATVAQSSAPLPEYAADCPFCAGNRRDDGGINPETGAFVFDNSHPCVGPDAPEELTIPPSPYRVRRADGLARVLCYSPRHNLTIAEMPHEMIAEIVRIWQQQSFDLGARPDRPLPSLLAHPGTAGRTPPGKSEDTVLRLPWNCSLRIKGNDILNWNSHDRR